MKPKLIWYPMHIEAYNRDTAHLSMLEHGAYLLLLNHYYLTASPIPANELQLHRVCRAFANEEQSALHSVLQQFFQLTDAGWIHNRAEKELAKSRDISDKRRQAAESRHSKAAEEGKKDGANADANADAIAGANGHTTTTTTTLLCIPDGIHNKARKKFDALSLELPTCVSAEAWGEWIAYRRERKITSTEATMRAQLKKLAAWAGIGHMPDEIIRASIENGWQGLFEPKQQAQQRSQNHAAGGKHGERMRVAAEIFGTGSAGIAGNYIEATAVRVV